MSGQEDQISGTALEEAATWHVRLQAETASEADFLAFETWVNDANHRAAFDRIDLLSAEFEASGPAIVKQLDAAPAKVLSFQRDEKTTTGSSQRTTRRLWIGGAVAAGLGLLVATPILRQLALNWTTYQTAAGETRAITLEDGSVVTLNGASQIKVAFTPKERRVEMTDAEATFDVTKNPSRPFLISAREHEIRVVGTEFNVFNFDDATRVTVRRGIVQVRSKNIAQTVRLPAGQEMSQKGREPALVYAVDPETAFSWRSGILVYDDAPLTDVVAALNRQFKIPLRLADDAAGGLRFSGVLSLDSEEAVVRRLEAFLPITAEYSDGQYLFRRRAR